MEEKKIINEILREYDVKKGIALEKRNRETKKAYEACPALLDMDKKINELGLFSMRKILADKENSQRLKKDFEKELQNLIKERNKLILDNKINPDYNKPAYECKMCEDSGFTPDGKRCECFEARIREIYHQKSDMGNMLLVDNFDEFDLKYYSDKTDKDGYSSRKTVALAVECAKKFCREFDNINYNLFFYGNTGLGKTFLSSIIAKNVINMGKTVKYVRATKLFATYDDYKFKDYSLKSEIDDFYNCDLLVIDDLGTENINKNGIAFLFDLINDRLINEKKIIINTNIPISSFSEEYTVRLTSRIYENFKIFCFEGEDIRIRKLVEKNS